MLKYLLTIRTKNDLDNGRLSSIKRILILIVEDDAFNLMTL
jgi:hypothetical protein